MLTVEEGEHPLMFWKKQEKNFPHLTLLAKNYLTISASSAPVEAMFSTCGLMPNVKRSSTVPYRANILSVIHDNYPKFFPITRAGAAADAKHRLTYCTQLQYLDSKPTFFELKDINNLI